MPLRLHGIATEAQIRQYESDYNDSVTAYNKQLYKLITEANAVSDGTVGIQFLKWHGITDKDFLAADGVHLSNGYKMQY